MHPCSNEGHPCLSGVNSGPAKSSSSGFCAPLNSCEIKYKVLNSVWGFSVQNIETLGQCRKMKPGCSQKCTVEAGEAMDVIWNMGKF